MTLPEVIISMVIVGVLLSALSAAMSVMLRTTPRTEQSVEAGRDVDVVQSWLPLDLASAAATDSTATADPTTANTLPGTNVLTIEQSGVAEIDVDEVWISYRYVQSGKDWQLQRFVVHNVGTPSETVESIVVAHRLAKPPVGWSQSTSPAHAVAVTNRPGATPGSIDQSFTLTFANQSTFTVGGAQLATDSALSGDPQLGTADPGAAPTKCGGTISLVLDTSGSIPIQAGGEQLKAAAINFVDSFLGTPVQMNVIGFDNQAYPMAPTNLGEFVSMLNTSSDTTAMRTRISVIDNNDGFGYLEDTNGDGIHWNQVSPGGTDWEDAMWAPFFKNNGQPWQTTADLVIFVTDGQPNWVRPGSTQTDPLVAAQIVANQGRATGARIVGVMVGVEAGNPASVSNLKSVVGSVEYDAAANGGTGNAASADYFTAAFTNTAAVLKQIMAAQCGGTITLQKKIDEGGVLKSPPKNSTWSFDTDLGIKSLDLRKESSVTLDYTFSGGVSSKTVRVVEDTTPAGYVFDRIQCSKGGVSQPSKVTQPIVSGGQTLAGADITLSADEALSCVVVSKKV